MRLRGWQREMGRCHDPGEEKVPGSGLAVGEGTCSVWACAGVHGLALLSGRRVLQAVDSEGCTPGRCRGQRWPAGAADCRAE